MTRLDAIRQRVEQAPEPVVVGEKDGPSRMHSVVNRRGNVLGMFPAKSDAEWYACSREDIPALLAVVEAARRVIERYIAFGPSDGDWADDMGKLNVALSQLLQEVKG